MILMLQLQHNENEELELSMAGDSVQAEVCNCQGNVKDIKEKLIAMKATVQQKTAEVAQLKKQFAEQSEALIRVTKDYEDNKQKMAEEINTLNQTVRDICYF